MQENLKVLAVKNWERKNENRREWRKNVIKAKTHTQLYEDRRRLTPSIISREL